MKSRVFTTHRNSLIALVAVSLIAVAAAGAGWYFILGVSADANRLNSETTNLTNEASLLSTLKIRLQKVASQHDLVYETIPTTKDVSSFLATFEQLSSRHSLTIHTETVGSQQSNMKTGNDFSQTVNKQQYYLLPISLVVNGNYADLQSMISDLATTRRLASLTNLVITADTLDKANPSRVRATFTINVYLKK